MNMKLQLRTAVAVTCMALAMAAAPVRAAEVQMVTGEQWTQSSDAVKKAYLVGLANMVQVQTAYQGANPPTDAQSFMPRLAKGMQGQTLDGVRENLDRWYAANPTKLKRPVLDIIWFEMAVPGLKK
ncbi:hypothetical protein QTI24_06380 [Variovorax sp. J22P240]|uniref:hypothetical protein n=1 Tax=Variovorax sp. J22P240 TaxID=3053514 RepID=UPI0025773883|nr:hypothetical protein [Variovorax sp. J22P240]MDL9998222.1 hypothetical protein [Variovorax sp. J22P240]